MKKLILAVFTVGVFSIGNAQDTSFGVKAGADFASFTAKGGGTSISASETGFYVGVFAQISISEKFAFQPEVMYVSIDDGGEIHIPLMGNFSISEEFSLLAGPALGILTDTGDGIKSFNYGLEAGASYDISDSFLVEARYSLGLANLLEDAPDSVSLKLNGFYVGLGYKF